MGGTQGCPPQSRAPQVPPHPLREAQRKAPAWGHTSQGQIPNPKSHRSGAFLWLREGTPPPPPCHPPRDIRCRAGTPPPRPQCWDPRGASGVNGVGAAWHRGGDPKLRWDSRGGSAQALGGAPCPFPRSPPVRAVWDGAGEGGSRRGGPEGGVPVLPYLLRAAPPGWGRSAGTGTGRGGGGHCVAPPTPKPGPAPGPPPGSSALLCAPPGGGARCPVPGAGGTPRGPPRGLRTGTLQGNGGRGGDTGGNPLSRL